jgi:hypothetical protein
VSTKLYAKTEAPYGYVGEYSVVTIVVNTTPGGWAKGDLTWKCDGLLSFEDADQIVIRREQQNGTGSERAEQELESDPGGGG